MRAQVLHEPGRMALTVRPIPRPSATEALVRVRRCGLCGSDVAYYAGRVPLGTPSGRGPLVLGHEFAGEIVELGAVARGASGLGPGDRVAVDPLQPCHGCEACAAGHPHLCPRAAIAGVSRDGGLAEYAVAPYPSLRRLPPEVDDAAAAFVEPLACAVHGMEKLAVRPGQVVVVFGPGPMGLLLVRLARLLGAGRIVLVGTRDDRLAVGGRYGADHLVNLRDPRSPHHVPDLRRAVAELSGGRLADRAILATQGAEPFAQALEVTGPLAIVVYFALPAPDEVLALPARACKTTEKEIRFARLAPLAWPTALRLLAEGLVDPRPLLSAVVPLEGSADGLDRMRARTGGTLKVQVAP